MSVGGPEAVAAGLQQPNNAFAHGRGGEGAAISSGVAYDPTPAPPAGDSVAGFTGAQPQQGQHQQSYTNSGAAAVASGIQNIHIHDGGTGGQPQPSDGSGAGGTLPVQQGMEQNGGDSSSLSLGIVGQSTSMLDDQSGGGSLDDMAMEGNDGDEMGVDLMDGLDQDLSPQDNDLDAVSPSLQLQPQQLYPQGHLNHHIPLSQQQQNIFQQQLQPSPSPLMPSPSPQLFQPMPTGPAVGPLAHTPQPSQQSTPQPYQLGGTTPALPGQDQHDANQQLGVQGVSMLQQPNQLGQPQQIGQGQPLDGSTNAAGMQGMGGALHMQQPHQQHSMMPDGQPQGQGGVLPHQHTQMPGQQPMPQLQIQAQGGGMQPTPNIMGGMGAQMRGVIHPVGGGTLQIPSPQPGQVQGQPNVMQQAGGVQVPMVNGTASIQQQHQAGVQGRTGAHVRLVGGWQSNSDIPHRKKILTKIVAFLQQRKPQARPEWIKKVPQMARRLEDALYRNASSFDEYNDMSTLRQRLQHLALRLGNKAQQAKLQHRAQGGQEGGGAQAGQGGAGQPYQGNPQVMITGGGDGSNSNPQLQQLGQGVPPGAGGMVLGQGNAHMQMQQHMMQQNLIKQKLQHDQMEQLKQQTLNNTLYGGQQNQLQQQMQQLQQQGGGGPNNIMAGAGNVAGAGMPNVRKFVNMSDINPMMGQPGQGNNNNNNGLQQNGGANPNNMGAQGGGLGMPGGMGVQIPPPGQQLMGGGMVDPSQNNVLRTPAAYTPEQRKQALWQQQQRLLLLRHASKCQAPPDRCTATPHCAKMKSLWKHIAECKDSSCKVAHCISSRFVLSHYHRCQDSKCDVCAPVKEVIHKSGRSGNPQGQLNPQGGGGPGMPGMPMNMNPGQFQGFTQAAVAKMTPQHKQAYQELQRNVAASQRIKKEITSVDVKSLTAQEQARYKKMMTEYNAQQHMHAQQLRQLQEAQIAAQAQEEPPPPVNPAPTGKGTKRTLQRAASTTTGRAGRSTRKGAQANNAPDNETNGIAGIGEAMMSGMGDQIVSNPKRSKTSPRLAQMSPFAKQEQSRNNMGNDSMDVQAPAPTRTRTKMEIEERIERSAGASSGPRDESKMVSPEDITSLVEAFTVEEIQAHIASLSSESQLDGPRIKQLCMPALKELQESQFGWVFNSPVDPVQLDLPDYFTIIETPMDLGTVKKSLDSNRFSSINAFAKDVRLVFQNAMKYNPPGSEVYPVAEGMLKQFDQAWNRIKRTIKEEDDKKKDAGGACDLCGGSQIKFEPAMYYCNGPNCNGNRIRRNSHFYTGGNNEYHWCQQCFTDLPDNEIINMGKNHFKKSDLTRKKNDDCTEEPWVQCNTCERWIHQVCALFNSRRNTAEETPYACPTCILKIRKRNGNLNPTARKHGSIELPHNPLSLFLEQKVKLRLEQCYQEEAKARGVHVDQIERAEHVHIKQVSSQDATHIVKPNFLKRYSGKKYPEDFPARTKCVLLFQELDGVDCLLFGMYVYEYGHQCSVPNHRRVYISYLDSVHYFRPRQYRTIVYKEILIAYLEYVKKRGFHTAHIWACPPLKGDDYILYCHPDDQKTPKDDRLRIWYITMLEDAKARGVVQEITDFYDEYLTDKTTDATVLPYLEGDYWIGEAENIIKDLENGESGPPENAGRAKKLGAQANKTKTKRNAKKWGPRASEAQEPDGRDPVMQKLAEVIQPMKTSFIVAFLHPREYAKQMEQRRAREQEIRLAEREVKRQKEQGITPSEELMALASTPIEPDETQENEEIMECEILDHRQAFLNLCRWNHYQFDQLRRTKHSSMMVLYHLCNPNAPKFLTNCANCQKEINSGHRWNCKTCEIDFCDECRRIHHPHELKPMPVLAQQNGQVVVQQTEAQRAERQRSIELHMQLLQHATSCILPACPSANCQRMKALLAHGSQCQVKVQNGCQLCRRVWALLQIHARQCKRDACPVPKCAQLREHMRQLAMQQQQYDSRRRQAMNEMMRARASGGDGSGS